LIADIIINKIFEKPVFTWNKTNLIKKDVVRSNYITAIKAADKGDINPLIDFAKS